MALFTAEAMPVGGGGTDDITALVSGATHRVTPQPSSKTGGSTDRAYPCRGASQAKAAKPVPARAAPAHISRRSPILGTSAPTRAENRNISRISGTKTAPAAAGA